VKRPLAVLIILLIPTFHLLRAQIREEYVPETDPLVLEKLEKWRDLKFGLMMTWGPYSQWGVVESWSLCAEDEPWCRRKTDNYAEYKSEYENLKKTFDPFAGAGRAVGVNNEEGAIAAYENLHCFFLPERLLSPTAIFLVGNPHPSRKEQHDVRRTRYGNHFLIDEKLR